MRLSSAILLCVVLFATASCAKRSITTSDRAEISNYSSSGQRQALININTASAKELEALPGIGKGLAERIVEHRQKYGPFARPEHLLMVRGISEHRFAALRDLITVE
jgi:competence protein ComEA